MFFKDSIAGLCIEILHKVLGTNSQTWGRDRGRSSLMDLENIFYRLSAMCPLYTKYHLFIHVHICHLSITCIFIADLCIYNLSVICDLPIIYLASVYGLPIIHLYLPSISIVYYQSSMYVSKCFTLYINKSIVLSLLCKGRNWGTNIKEYASSHKPVIGRIRILIRSVWVELKLLLL